MLQTRRAPGDVALLRRQYLHAFAATACVAPFLSYVLADAGWSPQQIGAAAAAVTIGAVATAPLWGRLDRRSGADRMAFRATAVAALLLCLAAATSPPWVVCVAAGLFGGASGSIDPLITARALRGAVTASRLGSTRAGGSIGWVLGLGCGATLLTFLSVPVLVFVLAAVAAACAPTLAPDPSDTPTHPALPDRAGVPLRTVATVLSITFPLGLCMSGLITFTAGWAHTELDAGPLVSVGPLAFSAALELPAFALVDRVGARLRSEALAALAFPPLGVAALVLAIAPGREALFAVQPLVATTFALMFVSQSRLTAERSTPATMASAQAVVSTVGRAGAASLAGVAGGAIATAGGYPRLFLTMAGICLLGGLRAAAAGRGRSLLRKGGP